MRTRRGGWGLDVDKIRPQKWKPCRATKRAENCMQQRLCSNLYQWHFLAARCMNRGLKLRPFPRRGPKMKNPFTIEKVSLVPSSAQKRKVYQSSDNTGSAYFCSLHYITLHSITLHGITFCITLCIKSNYVALQNIRFISPESLQNAEFRKYVVYDFNMVLDTI